MRPCIASRMQEHGKRADRLVVNAFRRFTVHPCVFTTKRSTMSKGRLEAFSDGVIAIIITIMALEMKVPQGADLGALRPLIPIFLSYGLSFMSLGVYWNNHHHF